MGTPLPERGDCPSTGELFAYLSVGSPGRPARWVALAQWVSLLVWLGFTWWILAGGGYLRAEEAMSVVAGIFAGEAVFKDVLLPNWGLVTVAVFALILVLQVVWLRSRVTIRRKGDRWIWSGRRGPESPVHVVRTLGGGWCKGEGRWRFVPGGFLDAKGRDWLRVAFPEGARIVPLSLLSPAVLLLVLLLVCAYAVISPARSFKRDLRALYGAPRDPTGKTETFVLARHPELKPFARYLSTLPACAEAGCLRAQIAARLEMANIGPDFGAGGATLPRLLILSGKGRLVTVLLGELSPAAFELAVRTGRAEEAREILERSPRPIEPRGLTLALLLMEENSFQQAYEVLQGETNGGTHRAIALEAVSAYLSGRCGRAEVLAGRLLHPSLQVQARLYGKVPATGLGALQRSAKEIRRHASIALGLLLGGHSDDALSEWRKAVVLAEEAGISGVLDTDRVLLRMLDPSFPAGSGKSSPGGSAGGNLASPPP